MRFKLFLTILINSFVFFVYAQKGPEKYLSLSDSSAKYINSDPEKSKEFIYQIIELSTKYSYPQGLGEAYMDLSMIEYYDGDIFQSLNYCHKADSLFQISKDTLNRALVISNRGILYADTKYYMKAIDELLLATTLFKEKEHQKGLSYTYSNLADIYVNKKDYSTALDYYNRALEIDLDMQDSVHVGIDLTNIGNIYMLREQYDKAEEIILTARDLFETHDNSRGKISCYYQYAELLLLQKKYDKSLEELHLALDFAIEIDYEMWKAIVMGKIGEVLIQQNKWDEASRWINKKVQICETYSDSIQLSESYKMLSEAYSLLGKNDSAFDALSKYVEINNLIHREENSRVLKNVELEHKLFNKENQLDFSLQQNTINNMKLREQNYVLIGSISVFLLILIIIFVIIKYRQQKWSMDKISLQQQLFRSQVDPHFIFNVFNSIQSCLINKEYEEGQIYLRKFATLIREFLEKSENRFSTIEEDIRLMKLYLEIEAFRLDNGMEFEFVIDEQIDAGNWLLPSFIAQVYLENAVWHGISNYPEGGKIVVELKKSKKEIILTISDNGIGIIKSKQSKSDSDIHQSKGMEITEKRIQNLNRRRKDKFRVQIIDLNDVDPSLSGTKVSLYLPVIEG